MTDGERKRRSIVQIVLLSAGLVILLGISATSIWLVYLLRQDADKIARTLEVENQILHFAAAAAPRRKRRARLPVDLAARISRRVQAGGDGHPAGFRPAAAAHHRQPRSDAIPEGSNAAGRPAAEGIQRGRRPRQQRPASRGQQDRPGKRNASDHAAHSRHHRRHAQRGRAPAEAPHHRDQSHAGALRGRHHRRLGRRDGAGHHLAAAAAALAAHARRRRTAIAGQ